MRAFLAAVGVVIVVAVGAGYVLNADNRTAYDAFSTTGARVGDPGSNLVGDRWTGLNRGG
jgi:hypothetical protein